MSCSFRENLREELDYQGIIIKELSAKTNIPIATLDCYLGARAAIPSVEAALKIARALQVSVEYLVTGKEYDGERPRVKLCREAREIIRLIEQLNPEQCKVILKLVDAFSVKTHINC